MKKLFASTAIFLSFLNCHSQSFYSKATFDQTAIHRIGDYGKLWIVLKLFHPSIAYGNINIDSLFTDNIGSLLETPSADNFKNALQRMIARLNDPYTNIDGNDIKKRDTFSFGDRPFIKWLADSIVLIHFDDQFVAQNSNPFSNNPGLVKLIDSLKNAHGVIIDLRSPSSIENDDSKYYQSGFMNQLISHLSNTPVPFPASRSRIHYGHESMNFEMPFYYQGWVLQNSSVVDPRMPILNKQVVLIINKYNNIISDAISALQSAGIVKVLAQGGLENFEPARSYQLELSDNVKVNIRLNEVVYGNGSASFNPDAIAKNSENIISEAIELLGSNKKTENITHVQQRNIFVRNKFEGYYGLSYPSAPLRLLALMRYWSAINYFCPNKDLITKNWDSVLYEFVPKFLFVKDSVEYMLTAAKLIKQINDTHGYFSSPVNNGMTANIPEIWLKYIENKTIVSRIFKDSLKKYLSVGDEVISIDDKSVNRCRDSLSQLISASNNSSLQRNVSDLLLAGRANSWVKLKYLHKNAVKEIRLERKVPRYFSPASTEKAWKKINDKLGYVDFGRIEGSQIDSMFNDLQATDAIIFDDRSYPRGTIWTIVNYLSEKTIRPAKGIAMIADSPDPLTSTVQESLWEIPVNPKRLYKGKIIILVNEITQSQAEYSCMVFQAASKNVTIIGSQTAGADGDVTGILLPGGIETAFSGHGVHYPDGRPTQGIGIVPDIKIKPTIKGLQAGRDEVLERAILFAKTGK